jgi:uncharacterized membrane protein
MDRIDLMLNILKFLIGSFVFGFCTYWIAKSFGYQNTIGILAIIYLNWFINKG